jgi:nitroimidazol reductase NimA-like FMN-containing flavoprotein (pyridoxamine 5'-phosphate oxidase superfamily)
MWIGGKMLTGDIQGSFTKELNAIAQENGYSVELLYGGSKQSLACFEKPNGEKLSFCLTHHKIKDLVKPETYVRDRFKECDNLWMKNGRLVIANKQKRNA